MMDRVPVYLEIDAAGMPHPCKIIMRPAARRYSDAVCNLVQQNMAIYLSTKTKNPCERNHQLKIAHPAKKVIVFAPGPEEKATGAKKDVFQDKVYIGIAYDISGGGEQGDKDKERTDEHGCRTDEGDGRNGGVTNDQISQVNMRIHVAFPKDKEEI